MWSRVFEQVTRCRVAPLGWVGRKSSSKQVTFQLRPEWQERTSYTKIWRTFQAEDKLVQSPGGRDKMPVFTGLKGGQRGWSAATRGGERYEIKQESHGPDNLARPGQPGGLWECPGDLWKCWDPSSILINLIWGGAPATDVNRGLCAARVEDWWYLGFTSHGREFVFSSKVEWEVTKEYLAEERWDLSNFFKRSL